jgi:hypothetical protein
MARVIEKYGVEEREVFALARILMTTTARRCFRIDRR